MLAHIDRNSRLVVLRKSSEVTVSIILFRELDASDVVKSFLLRCQPNTGIAPVGTSVPEDVIPLDNMMCWKTWPFPRHRIEAYRARGTMPFIVEPFIGLGKFLHRNIAARFSEFGQSLFHWSQPSSKDAYDFSFFN